MPSIIVNEALASLPHGLNYFMTVTDETPLDVTIKMPVGAFERLSALASGSEALSDRTEDAESRAEWELAERALGGASDVAVKAAGDLRRAIREAQEKDPENEMLAEIESIILDLEDQ